MTEPGQQAKSIANTSALAEHLGLSRWTVSRVLNDQPGVKPETRQRVREAMYEFGFLPDPMARGLRGSRTRLIGICFQEVDSPMLARKAMLLQNLLRQRGFRAILELTGGAEDLEVEALRQFKALRADGVALVGSALAPDHSGIHFLQINNIPLVLIDPLHDLPFPQVCLDREEAIWLKIKHLYDLGHRSFAIAGISRAIPYAETRWSGLRKALRRLKLTMRNNMVSLSTMNETGQSYADGVSLAERYLTLDERPTGIVALNDRIALGMLSRLRQDSLKAPRDFSIVGFDNIDITAYSHPTLTTVDQQAELMMTTACNILLRAIEEPDQVANQRQIVRPVLKARESTASP